MTEYFLTLLGSLDENTRVSEGSPGTITLEEGFIISGFKLGFLPALPWESTLAQLLNAETILGFILK